LNQTSGSMLLILANCFYNSFSFNIFLHPLYLFSMPNPKDCDHVLSPLYYFRILKALTFTFRPWPVLNFVLYGIRINNPPVPKTDTQETENFNKATCKHKMTDSGSSLYLWHSHNCPSPGIYPGHKFTMSLDWQKGLEDGLGHAVW
jgi:hypothetical protein